MTSPRLCRPAACVALLAFAAVPALAQKRDITEKDLFQFVWVADPQISPDGSQVVFVRVAVDEKLDQYDTSLWMARTDGATKYFPCPKCHGRNIVEEVRDAKGTLRHAVTRFAPA